MRKFMLLNVIIIFLFSYAGATRFILSSTPDGRGAIYVNDDIKITLEGENYSLVLVDDQNSNPNSVGPIEFEAEEGDVLTIEATDKSEAARMKSDKVPVPNGKKALSPIYLVYKGGGFAIPIFGGLPETNSSWEGEDTFVKITYKIGTLMRLYCLSSDENGCVPIYVNEDMTLFKFEYGDSYSVEIHPDNDGTDSHILVNIALPVLEEDGETPTYEVEFVNRRKDGELSRVYLVPEDGGLPITIVSQPKWIDGDCERFPECEETLLYSYQGPLNLPVSSGGISSVIAEFSKTYHENGKEGIWYNLTLTKPSPANIFVYWNVLGEANLFYTSEGYRLEGESWLVYSDITGEIMLPQYGVFEKLFVAGNYTLGILTDTGDSFEYELKLNVDEGNIEDLKATENDTDFNFIESKNSLTSTEDFIKSIIMKAELDYNYYINLPVERNEAVLERICYAYPVTVFRKVSKGFTYRFISESTAELIFIMWIKCEESRETSNGTIQTEVTNVPDDMEIIVESIIDNRNFEIKLKLIDNFSPNGGGSLYYNSLEIPLSSHNIPVLYRFFIRGNGYTLKTQEFSSSVVPPKVVVVSADNFINGVSFDTIMSNMESSLYVRFGLKLIGLTPSVDFTNYKAEVCIEEAGVCIPMEIDKNILKADMYIPIKGETTSFSYKFYVYNSDGRPLGGRLLDQEHKVEIVSNRDIALGISGYSAYVFGDTMKFTLSAVTSVLSDENYDVYLGLYKEGRGIIWMMDPVPGSGIYKTSVEKKPLLLNIDAEVCSSGCSWPFDIQIPDKFDFFAPFYYGKYVWILEFTKHGTDEVVARLYYPFSIKIE